MCQVMGMDSRRILEDRKGKKTDRSLRMILDMPNVIPRMHQGKTGQYVEVGSTMTFEDFSDMVPIKVCPWLHVRTQECCAHQLVACIPGCWNFSTMIRGWHYL